jgi:hypothetical protein
MTYAAGITSLTGLCDPIGPAPDYAYTGICPNTTLPLGDLQEVIAPLVCNNTNPAALSPACTNSGKLITENENATFTDLSQGKPPQALVPQSHVHSRLFLRLQNLLQ